MKTLYLLRHAKAQGAMVGMEDASRPLNARGEGDALELGMWLAANKMKVGLILCSPSVRTRQTLELLQKAWKHGARVEFVDGLYHASARQMVEQIQALAGEAASVLVIGHNPGIHELACVLAEDAPDELLEGFPTCTLARIEFDGLGWDGVERGKGKLAALLHPAKLKACA